MNIQRLRDMKKALGFTNATIAAISGVPLGTVEKIFGSTTKEPRRETYLAIIRALDPMAEYRPDFREMYFGGEPADEGASRVGEAMAAYEMDYGSKPQGEYTIEDYYALPDDRRVELIDGNIYDMGAPSFYHQEIAGEIFFQLKLCAKEHALECIPGISPIDVQLDKDNKTIVQPDVIVTCEPELVRHGVIYGAPEFVVEVLSPSTRRKDQIIKLNKYDHAGCKEVWLVDPEMRTVWVYDFRKEVWPDTYSFDDVVPVGISEGKCSVDFTEISKTLERLKSMMREE